MKLFSLFEKSLWRRGLPRRRLGVGGVSGGSGGVVSGWY